MSVISHTKVGTTRHTAVLTPSRAKRKICRVGAARDHLVAGGRILVTDDVAAFADVHRLPVLSIAELIAWRQRHAEGVLPAETAA
jgi:3,4-dihydroxy-2-butanone 4-phosphate synthase